MTPEQEIKLDKIHELLAGSLEKKGLVHKVEEHELDIYDLREYKEKDQKFKNKVAGGIAAGTPLLVGLWHWIISKIQGH